MSTNLLATLRTRVPRFTWTTASILTLSAVVVVPAVLALVTCLDMRQHQQLGPEAVKFHGRFLAGILNEVLWDALYSLGIDKAEEMPELSS